MFLVYFTDTTEFSFCGPDFWVSRTTLSSTHPSIQSGWPRDDGIDLFFTEFQPASAKFRHHGSLFKTAAHVLAYARRTRGRTQTSVSWAGFEPIIQVFQGLTVWLRSHKAWHKRFKCIKLRYSCKCIYIYIYIQISDLLGILREGRRNELPFT